MAEMAAPAIEEHEEMEGAAPAAATVSASASAEAGEGAAGVGAASASGGAVEKQAELEALIQVKLEAVSQEAEEAMQHAASIATWADSSPTVVPPFPWIGMDDVWVQLASSITVKDTTLARG